MCSKRTSFSNASKCVAWADAMAHAKDSLTVTCERCDAKYLRVNREQHERICVEGVIGCRACGEEFVRRKRGSHRCEEMTISKIALAYRELGELRKSYGDIEDERDLLRRQLTEVVTALDRETEDRGQYRYLIHPMMRPVRPERLDHQN